MRAEDLLQSLLEPMLCSNGKVALPSASEDARRSENRGITDYSNAFGCLKLGGCAISKHFDFCSPRFPSGGKFLRLSFVLLVVIAWEQGLSAEKRIAAFVSSWATQWHEEKRFV